MGDRSNDLDRSVVALAENAGGSFLVRRPCVIVDKEDRGTELAFLEAHREAPWLVELQAGQRLRRECRGVRRRAWSASGSGEDAAGVAIEFGGVVERPAVHRSAGCGILPVLRAFGQADEVGACGWLLFPEQLAGDAPERGVDDGCGTGRHRAGCGAVAGRVGGGLARALARCSRGENQADATQD